MKSLPLSKSRMKYLVILCDLNQFTRMTMLKKEKFGQEVSKIGLRNISVLQCSDPSVVMKDYVDI